MELRVLQYFLAVAREQSFSGAAQSLHLSQPTLSTQLKALEEELGKQLFVRGSKGSRKVTLTSEGMVLRKRAEEILDLVHKAETEIALSDDAVAGMCISVSVRRRSCAGSRVRQRRCARNTRIYIFTLRAATPISSWNSWTRG